MRCLALSLIVMSCATVESSVTQTAPLEVNGRVMSACALSQPVRAEEVRLRFAGDLDAVEIVQTDLNGTFTARVMRKGDVVAPLFVEARGVKTLAKQTVDYTHRGLVAELVVPCGE